MASVVTPILCTVEHITGIKSGQFGDYRSVLFLTATGEKIWKSFPADADEVNQIHKGDRVQLIRAGKDKSGKDKHNIVLLDSPTAVSDPPPNESTTVAAGEWSPERKRAIALYLESQLSLLGHCDKQARQTFDGLPEETIQKYAVTLFLAAQKKFGL